MSKSIGKILPVVAGFLGGMMNKKSDPAPAPAPPTTMPDPMASAQSKRKRAAESASRGGRMSTILTDAETDKLGG